MPVEKTLFIDPPFYRIIGTLNRYFPYGITVLATYLNENGYDCLVYNADFAQQAANANFTNLESLYDKYLETVRDETAPIWVEIENFIKEYSPDIVCISCWTTYIASSLKIAEIVKSIDENIVVIGGGPHVTLKPIEILNNTKNIDYLVIGEGENTLLELVSFLDNSKTDIPPSHINGLCYRENGKVIKTKKRELIGNIENIPFPNRKLLFSENKYSAEDMGLIMTTRGCPFSCSFCASFIWEKKIRFFSTKKIISEIRRIKYIYGTKFFSIKDDMFVFDRKRVIDFCQTLIKDKICILWECNGRVKFLDADLLKLMKKAGCIGIKIGIESGDENVLKSMKKKITICDIKNTAELLKKSGIFWTGYFMMGVPNETKQNISDTYDLMKELKPDYASFSVYEVFPGTEFFDYGVKIGLLKKMLTINDYMNVIPCNFYLSDPNKKSNVLSTEDFRKIEKYMKNEFDRYNRKWSNVFKRLKSRLKLYKYPSNIIRDIKAFVKWY